MWAVDLENPGVIYFYEGPASVFNYISLVLAPSNKFTVKLVQLDHPIFRMNNISIVQCIRNCFPTYAPSEEA